MGAKEELVHRLNAVNVVMNHFGPVNSNVGHRRLSVLFTRAKQRVDVFTSMRSDDIKTPDGSSLGVKHSNRTSSMRRPGG